MSLYLIVNFIFTYINYLIFYILVFIFFKKNIIKILLENRYLNNNKDKLFDQKEKLIKKNFKEKVDFFDIKYKNYKKIYNKLLILEKINLKEKEEKIEQLKLNNQKNIEISKIKNELLARNFKFKSFKNGFYETMKNESRRKEDDFFIIKNWNE